MLRTLDTACATRGSPGWTRFVAPLACSYGISSLLLATRHRYPVSSTNNFTAFPHCVAATAASMLRIRSQQQPGAHWEQRTSVTKQHALAAGPGSTGRTADQDRAEPPYLPPAPLPVTPGRRRTAAYRGNAGLVAPHIQHISLYLALNVNNGHFASACRDNSWTYHFSSLSLTLTSPPVVHLPPFSQGGMTFQVWLLSTAGTLEEFTSCLFYSRQRQPEQLGEG